MDINWNRDKENIIISIKSVHRIEAHKKYTGIPESKITSLRMTISHGYI